MAEDKTAKMEVKLDERVAAKLDSILDGLNAIKETGVDWKSVFISVALNVVLLTAFYVSQIKDLPTRDWVNQEIDIRTSWATEIHSIFYKKIDGLEADVKKLKDRRIGSVGKMGDEGPK